MSDDFYEAISDDRPECEQRYQPKRNISSGEDVILEEEFEDVPY